MDSQVLGAAFDAGRMLDPGQFFCPLTSRRQFNHGLHYLTRMNRWFTKSRIE